ncbi:hypothetical protein [Arenibacter sp. F20364]|uniref:hypothetical protein n=1 Tax=Arenibacter sp. F20364 TaxID=2926415 RepID=UPI001FF39A7E|nr:hypothetical protein [Arenibacter sp. F20364]MCK0189132.1 hypothetical protein [Arenibacter sp. F20364]
MILFICYFKVTPNFCFNTLPNKKRYKTKNSTKTLEARSGGADIAAELDAKRAIDQASRLGAKI